MRSLNPNVPRLVVCAAVKDMATGEVFCGARHGDAMNLMHRLGIKSSSELSICGFVDQDNDFMTREEAWIVADAAGQIRRPYGLERDYNTPRPANIGDKSMLFSENLY